MIQMNQKTMILYSLLKFTQLINLFDYFTTLVKINHKSINIDIENRES
jgi:hypothetical protein